MFPNYVPVAPQDFAYQQHAVPMASGQLRPGSCTLTFRQQPNQALVTVAGKEKVRKPLDPPPILELTVSPRTDPQRQYLQNPFLFACATLYKPDKDEPFEMSTDKSLVGTLVSSLHRLKDISNKDGGFFVFGDVSIKTQGTFRLCFTLYEFQQEALQVQHLASAISNRFEVVPAKDFKGLEESTYLSRAFSDQGVRLRLRKEPRSNLHKRSNPFESMPSSHAPLRPSSDHQDLQQQQQQHQQQQQQPAKRSRQEYSLPTHDVTTSSFVDPMAGSIPGSMGGSMAVPMAGPMTGSIGGPMGGPLGGSMGGGPMANVRGQPSYNAVNPQVDPNSGWGWPSGFQYNP
ncbi:Nn.00g046860.m01.CDS01 [Neocucurbitaria sp. VM-36]